MTISNNLPGCNSAEEILYDCLPDVDPDGIPDMEDNCPEEVKSLENEQGPALDDLTNEYMSLGQELGYSDDQGNLLKPIEIPKEEIAALSNEPKLSKKQQKYTHP